MKQPLAELLAKAAATIPPQKPRYHCYLPVMVMLHTHGHTSARIADFLIKQKEIPDSERDSATRSVRNLLARHSPTA